MDFFRQLPMIWLETTMSRAPLLKPEDIVLAALSPGGASTYSAVQIQKSLFLIDREIPKLVNGPHFNFKPYHYGPFDKGVYEVVGKLEASGDMEVDRDPNLRIRNFRLTQQGIERGRRVMDAIPKKAKDYIERVSSFVRQSTFAGLVSAIYKTYPEMKKKSVFPASS
jgi:hypothetical protein